MQLKKPQQDPKQLGYKTWSPVCNAISRLAKPKGDAELLP